MIEAKTINAKEEKELLQAWFDSVEFDKPSEGIPELDPEPDDEGRSAIIAQYLPDAETETLLAELRKRDPDNPF